MPRLRCDGYGRNGYVIAQSQLNTIETFAGFSFSLLFGCLRGGVLVLAKVRVLVLCRASSPRFLSVRKLP